MRSLFNQFGCVVSVSVIVGLLAASTAGQCPMQWLPGEGIRGVDGGVLVATPWDPDGAGPRSEVLVAGGTFTIAGNEKA